MGYEPAFFEVFLAWTVSVLWARWLLARGAPGLFDWLPWVAGTAVLVGQVMGAMSVFGGGLELDPSRSWVLVLARWGPFVVVLGVLALELAATLARLSSGRAGSSE